MSNQTQLIVETNKLNTQNTNHILHLLLSVVTVGWWVPVWILVSLSNSIERGKTERRIEKMSDE